jgi:hypothetical protein
MEISKYRGPEFMFIVENETANINVSFRVVLK